MFAILAGIWLKSAAILAVAWMVAWLLKGRSAASRHLVWTAATAGILALPALTLALPSWRVAAPATAPGNVGLIFRVLAVAGEDAAPPQAAIAGGQATNGSGGAPARFDWRSWAVGIWAIGCATVLLQMAGAYLRLRRRLAAAGKFRSGELRVLAASMGIDREVTLLEAPPASMPMAVGVLRPAILLPSDAVEWSEERRRMVLLHELAHVLRGDVATHLMARAALGLNWWNPLAWLAWREFLRECERAADDLVLAMGARPSDYAGHLLAVAQAMQSPGATAWAALAMARRPQLEGRLAAILDSRTRRQAVGRMAPVLAAVAAVALIAPLAAVRAQDQAAGAAPPELDATIRAANSQKNHEILERAAAAYEKLQKYDVAQTLLEQALTIRGEVSGDQSAAYAAGLVKLGDLELKRNKRPEAIAFYTKAVSLGDRPETAKALLELGVASMKRDPEEAHDYLQRAANADPMGPQAGNAYTWIAELRGAQMAAPAEVESLYQKALSVEGADTAERANTMHLYARYLEHQDRGSEAESMEAQAKKITQAYATRYISQMGLGGGVGAGSGRRVAEDATSPAPGGVFKVGSGVTPPALLSKTEPQYTEEARAAKYQGTVLVYVEVGPDGYAHNMKVVRGLGLGLDEKAIEAVSQWKFRPGTKDGQPVTVQATIEVNFRLL